MYQISNNIKIKNVTNVVVEKSPSFSGILTQECKGDLWVDNLDKPRIAIAKSYAVGSFAFLGTNERKEDFTILKEFLDNDLLPHLKESGYDCFEFSIESEGIAKNILELFAGITIQTEQEFSFRIHKIPEDDLSIPIEYQLRKVDPIFWNMVLEGKFENEDFLKVRLQESWCSFEDFMNNSIAYCIIFGNRIVAVMVGTACYQHVVAIDIETEKEHRRKGLAYAMSKAFITDCLKNGLIPQWDCVFSNPSSYNMAQKLGFEKTNENIVYWFNLSDC